MKTLARIMASIVPLIWVAGCAQFTTSDAELANMKSIADTRAEEYISCMKSEATNVSGSTDYAFVAKAVSSRCQSSLDTYRAAQEEYLGAQYMMTSEPLEESVQALEARAETEVAEMLVSRESSEPVPVAVPPARQAEGLSLSTAPVAAASAAAVGAATAWNPEQRIYLDCMDEQADRYARLNESAEAIATVAANKCRTYLTVERRAQLEAEGKAKVMEKVMDARLAPR